MDALTGWVGSLSTSYGAGRDDAPPNLRSGEGTVAVNNKRRLIIYLPRLKCARARILTRNLPLIKTGSYNLQDQA
jgi:hypothetical protein